MAARKSRASGARTSGDRPVLGDMLLSQADVPDRDDPPVQLDSPRNFFVIDHRGQAHARRAAAARRRWRPDDRSSRRRLRARGRGARSHSPAQGRECDAEGLRTIPSAMERRVLCSTCGGIAVVRVPTPSQRGARASRDRFSAGRSAGLLSQQLPLADRRPHLRLEQCVVAELGVVGVGVLVSRNAILTASHVVPWNSGRLLRRRLAVWRQRRLVGHLGARL